MGIPDSLDGGQVVGLETRWRHARYWPEQWVMAHMDFRHKDRADDCVCSRISFTLYLSHARGCYVPLSRQRVRRPRRLTRQLKDTACWSSVDVACCENSFPGHRWGTGWRWSRCVVFGTTRAFSVASATTARQRPE